MEGKVRGTLSDALGEVQCEKLAARPMEVDFRAALALHSKALEDLMDDKYLALQDEIRELRRQLRVFEERFKLVHPRGWRYVFQWFKRRTHVYGELYENDGVDE